MLSFFFMSTGTERRDQLAEERTETAYRRTFLAEERTYSAWLRTGLGAMATGVVIVKLMGEAGPSWLIRALGGLFILSSAVMFWLGFWAYRRGMRRLPAGAVAGIPQWVLGALTATMVFGAAMGVALVVLE